MERNLNHSTHQFSWQREKRDGYKQQVHDAERKHLFRWAGSFYGAGRWRHRELHRVTSPLLYSPSLYSRSGRLSSTKGTIGTLSIVARSPGIADTRGMKRTVQVNVKMTQDDFSMLRKA